MQAHKFQATRLTRLISFGQAHLRQEGLKEGLRGPQDHLDRFHLFGQAHHQKSQDHLNRFLRLIPFEQAHLRNQGLKEGHRDRCQEGRRAHFHHLGQDKHPSTRAD